MDKAVVPWKKFVRLPKVVMAVQWEGPGHLPTIVRPHWRSEEACPRCGASMSEHGLLPVVWGELVICPGDWIVEWGFGEYRALPPDKFQESFVPLDSEEGKDMMNKMRAIKEVDDA